MKLVRGDLLPQIVRREVLAAYGYRWTSDNTNRVAWWQGISGKPTIPTCTDVEWLRRHAFWVINDGGRLARSCKHALPSYMAQ